MFNNQPNWPKQIVEESELWRQQGLILGSWGYQSRERQERLTTFPKITEKKILHSILDTFSRPELESMPINLAG
jgi:hypothetical protein